MDDSLVFGVKMMLEQIKDMALAGEKMTISNALSVAGNLVNEDGHYNDEKSRAVAELVCEWMDTMNEEHSSGGRA